MEFRDPPEDTRRPDREYWRTVAQQLDENPNRWAFVGRWSGGVASRIRRGEYVAFLPPGMADKAQRRAYITENYEVYACESDGADADIYIRKLVP